MTNTNVTAASLRSVLGDTRGNLDRAAQAAEVAEKAGARILFLPELMLTGHGGHETMIEAAEPVPEGPLSRAVLELSEKRNLCICVGLAELSKEVVYNSYMVADRGVYRGLQRKMYLSGDEYCFFGAGESVAVFDIGDIRFGISICYDNRFPELALIHSLNHVDLILAPHASRMRDWPDDLTPEFCASQIREQQRSWEILHRARAYDHNVYVLLCNAVGSSTGDLKGVVANHAGTVMGVDPGGEVFLRTERADFTDEIVTVELDAERRKKNHAPARNRRVWSFMNMLREFA